MNSKLLNLAKLSSKKVFQTRAIHPTPARLQPLETIARIDAETEEFLSGEEASKDVFSADTSPNIFLRRHDREGRPIPGDIIPSEMLVATYRAQQHIPDTIAEMISYWFVRYTRDENWGKAVIQMFKRFGAFKEKESFFDYKELEKRHTGQHIGYMSPSQWALEARNLNLTKKQKRK